VATLNVRDLGDYIREQRKNAQISLRQLARLAGVSNPYLSQIERGLRKPSAEILQQIAKALRISAEALYVQAGILEERFSDSDVPVAVLGDGALTERQKQVLLEIYESFRKENEGRVPEGSPDDGVASAVEAAQEAASAGEPAHGASTPPARNVTRRLKRPTTGGDVPPATSPAADAG
jgi:transcriptional regulator with XRE-family HTH domain